MKHRIITLILALAATSLSAQTPTPSPTPWPTPSAQSGPPQHPILAAQSITKDLASYTGGNDNIYPVCLENALWVGKQADINTIMSTQVAFLSRHTNDYLGTWVNAAMSEQAGLWDSAVTLWKAMADSFTSYTGARAHAICELGDSMKSRGDSPAAINAVLIPYFTAYNIVNANASVGGSPSGGKNSPYMYIYSTLINRSVMSTADQIAFETLVFNITGKNPGNFVALSAVTLDLKGLQSLATPAPVSSGTNQ